MIPSEGNPTLLTLGRAFLRSVACGAVFTCVSIVFVLQVQGSTLRPYTADAETLHLWHMNEQAVPVIDLGSDGMHLTALRNGATLGNVSYRGFGTALSTYDGGPESTADAGHDAYLSARPLVNGQGDNVLMNYAGTAGAFTFEAMVRIDFEPETAFSTNSVATNHGTFLQIINLDADENTNRVCQFRLVPIGVLKGNTAPLLEFINLNKDKSPQSLTAHIPTSGPDAIRFGNWYHAAVTFDGDTNRGDNLKFYWTLVDPARAKANLIGTGQMTNELPGGCSPDFAIGQTGRQSPVTPYPNQNFPGLIDEVRISGVARTETQMLFDGQQVIAAATPTGEASSAIAAPDKGRAPVPETTKAREAGEGWSTTNTMITGGIIIIAGLLGWLLYVIRRLVFGGAKAIVPVPAKPVPQKVTVASAIQDATAMLKEVDSLICQATEYQPRSRSGTTSFRKKNSLEEVEEAQEGETDPDIGFRGIMRKVGLEDLIQLECMNCKSTLLEISNGKIRGRIYIERGEIIHADADGLIGEPALYKVLALRGGQFSLKGLEQPERRTIQGQWMQLLMEAAQQRDEETNFITADADADAKGFTFVPSSSSQEEVVAMATMLGEHPHVKELVLIANEGDVLYSSKCPDSAGRASACNELLEAAKSISSQLPLGEFHHLEILNEQSRTVIQPAQGHHLMIGTPAGASV
jgi:Domain of unknown function (DUF4388)/Concanavalin A-like lectin/glucanases superfamily